MMTLNHSRFIATAALIFFASCSQKSDLGGQSRKGAQNCAGTLKLADKDCKNTPTTNSDGTANSGNPTTTTDPTTTTPTDGSTNDNGGGGGNVPPGGSSTDNGGGSAITQVLVKMGGEWIFDGCGYLNFDLNTGMITLASINNDRFFGGVLAFTYADNRGISYPIVVRGNQGPTSLPNWQRMCLIAGVQTPTGTPLDGSRAGTPPVIQVQPGPGGNAVMIVFDDSGAGSPGCPAGKRNMPGAIRVNPATLQFFMKPC